jgi:hypothetical protein
VITQQHGFVNNKSCLTNLLVTLDLITKALVDGPLLFVIFINDLCNNINNDCKRFADNTKVISISKPREDKVLIQKGINGFNKWTNDCSVRFGI